MCRTASVIMKILKTTERTHDHADVLSDLSNYSFITLSASQIGHYLHASRS